MPLPIKDVDTDMIIPAQYLTSISRAGYGENVFRRLRDSDTEFPMNKPEFSAAKVIVADSNFGCGSSREHAVWAIQGAGFEAVISKSFADIFFSNSAKNGLLLIHLEDELVDSLLEQARGGELELEIDLPSQTVNIPRQGSVLFEYDAFRKHCLVEGVDDLTYLLSHKEDIISFREARQEKRFYRTDRANR